MNESQEVEIREDDPRRKQTKILLREHLQDVLALFRRWELHADVVCVVTDDGMATVRDGDEVVEHEETHAEAQSEKYLDSPFALIIDGQNNHAVWPKSTIMMKHYLEETGLFKVEIDRTRFTWKAAREKAFLPLAGVGETEDLKKPKSET